MNKFLTNISRLGFIAWLVFEFLNYIGVLHFTIDFSWLGLVLTAGFVWVVLEIVSWRLKKVSGKPLPWIAFLLSLLSVSFDAFGDTHHFYSRFDWYDQVAHVIGGAMAALVAFVVFWRLVEAGRIMLGKKLTGFVALCISAFLGVLYELEEYLEDVFTGSQRAGNSVDTSNDLLWNTVGALVIVVITVLLTSHASHSEDPERSEGDEESSRHQ